MPLGVENLPEGRLKQIVIALEGEVLETETGDFCSEMAGDMSVGDSVCQIHVRAVCGPSQSSALECLAETRDP